MATKRKIFAGPGKFEIMMALFEGKEVTFTLEGLGIRESVIYCVEAEDGSHESWNIKGRLCTTGLEFRGYFQTRTRQGFIEVDFPETDNVSNKTPKIGDIAYTWYQGQRLEGEITSLNASGTGCIEPRDPKKDWGFHRKANFTMSDGSVRPLRGLTFGYEKPVTWDDKAGMWYAPADSD